MNIPLVDLKAQYISLKQEIDAAFAKVMGGGEFILGHEVKSLESEISSYCGSEYAIAVASGTEALLLALLACGIKPGDEVVTTPFTFVATAETIAQCGAKPVFVDIETETWNIDPSHVEAAITPRTRAILPVHLYGHPADMDPILQIASKYNLMIIEDCAQAFGSSYNGRKVGSIGNAGCLSFFPSKILGAYGDGGMVLTSHPEIAEKVKMLRNHGSREKYYNVIHGFNSRLDSLQGAFLRVKLRYIDQWIKDRRHKAAHYSEILRKYERIGVPVEMHYGYHVFNYYTISLKKPEDRDLLRSHLTSQGIATAVYYPLSLHLQEVYRELGYRKGDFPQSEKAQSQVLSLPMYAELTEEQVEAVASAIAEF
ncbi:DegT/DnrJ/EryC1/StrS family aminotransferase [Chloroflexota bacterium]